MFVRRDLTDTVPTPSGNMRFVKKGSGYPVVLLHPLGTSIWTWEGVILPIPRRRHESIAATQFLRASISLLSIPGVPLRWLPRPESPCHPLGRSVRWRPAG